MWPLPGVEDEVISFGNSYHFSSLDFNSGFWQIKMSERDIRKCSFVTMDGQFEFVRMPLELSGATATFQKAINCILAHLKWKGVVCYIDDVLIGGNTFETHPKLLEVVLSAASTAGFTISPKKCEMAFSEITFLGYIISKNGLRTDPTKIEAIKYFPKPNTVKEIKFFVGALTYYRSFIKDFSAIAEPLLRSTRKDVKYEWSFAQNETFEKIKELMITVPILKTFDPFYLRRLEMMRQDLVWE